jgi:Domain of unknown function (DUF3943)
VSYRGEQSGARRRVLGTVLVALLWLFAMQARATAAPVEPLLPSGASNASIPAPLPSAEPPPPPEQPKYLGLALIESTLALGGGVIWYYTDGHFNQQDWDYTWGWQDWKKRLVTFDAIRFDDNAFKINALVHPMVGAGIYLIARGNRLGPVPAFLIAWASSTVWEFLIEYREVASINDMIFTPITGLAIGEPMIRLSNLLRTGEPGPIKEVLATVLNPIDAVNGWFERRPSRTDGPTDTYGMPLLYRHRLQLAAGFGYADFGSAGTRTEIQGGTDLFVDATPALRETGARTDVVGPGALDWVSASISGVGWQAVAAHIQCELALVGWLFRRTHGIEDGQPTSSHSVFLGLGTGYNYDWRSRPDLESDSLGIARLVGPLFDWGFQRGELTLHLVSDLFYDFAMVHALPLSQYEAALGTSNLASVIANHSYYYAQGLSASLRLIVEYQRMELGASASEDDFWIIQGRDRFHTPLLEPAGRDRRAQRRGWLAARPWQHSPLRALLAVDQITREGWFGTFEAHLSDFRVSIGLDLKF